MRFGNWKLKDNTIEWSGSDGSSFVIDKKSLLQTEDRDSLKMYKWIVLATGEGKFTEDDLYDLNFAFVYVAGALQSGFDYEIFDSTLDYQFEMLDFDNEDEDDDV